MKRLPIFLLFIVVLFILGSITIGLVFGLRQSKKLTKTNGQEECDSGHESYEIKDSSKLGKYSRAAVAVDNEECSHVGKSILLKGGKAVDAAIAASLCNGVLNSHSMGIGGGCVLVIYSKKQRKAFSIIERETAPLHVDRKIYLQKENLSLIGPLSIATPGELLAYREAYRRFGGGVPWSTLFTPAIRLCEKGFNVSRALAHAIKKNEKFILNDTQLREVFVKDQSTNELYQEGDLMKRVKLGRTLRQISNEGIETFYNGSLADRIIDEIQKKGGILTRDDLRQYRLDFQESLSVPLNDSLQIFTSSAPSSGSIIVLILNIMFGYHFHPNDLNQLDKASLFYHRLIETFKFAFAHREQLGDPFRYNLNQLINNLTSKNYAAKIREKINDDQTHTEEYYGKYSKKSLSSGGTAHISVVDEHGDAVAITSTINTYFGSMILGEHTGIIYNNEMDDFSDPMSTSVSLNRIAPGKRPISSQSPLIIVDNHQNIRLVLGASGGKKIITSVAQVALHNLLFNENIKQAIDHPRLHHYLSPNEILYEQTFNQEILHELQRRGHNLTCTSYGGSVVQGIEWRSIEKQYWANSDVRKGGSPDGY